MLRHIHMCTYYVVINNVIDGNKKSEEFPVFYLEIQMLKCHFILSYTKKLQATIGVTLM